MTSCGDGESAADFADPVAQRIFGSHPHGVGSLHHIGLMMAGPNACEPGKSFEAVSPGANRCELAASVLFRLPVLRELALAVGCCDASRAVVDRVLSRGSSVGVLVGGEQEQLLSQRGKRQTVYVLKRKGIMKVALRHGVGFVDAKENSADSAVAEVTTNALVCANLSHVQAPETLHGAAASDPAAAVTCTRARASILARVACERGWLRRRYCTAAYIILSFRAGIAAAR